MDVVTGASRGVVHVRGGLALHTKKIEQLLVELPNSVLSFLVNYCLFAIEYC